MALIGVALLDALVSLHGPAGSCLHELRHCYKDRDRRGVRVVLSGHTDTVTVVKVYNHVSFKNPYIISGSVDKTVRIWSVEQSNLQQSQTVSVITESDKTVNIIVVDPRSGIFVTGCADTILKIRRIEIDGAENVAITLLQTISISPRFFPLALSLSSLPRTPLSSILAVAGTKNIIQLYVTQSTQSSVDFQLRATLTGHEGWIRSLAFISERNEENADLLLASASQDKYVRLWRVHPGEDLPAPVTDPGLGVAGKSLANKAQEFLADGVKQSVTFEALLLGHDDWIYTVSWCQKGHRLQLLSASADGSLGIWESESSSGVWVCLTRLGESSGQKGATTATGSTGGYWIGLWSPTGKSVISLGRTGGWRLWNFNEEDQRWIQNAAVGGHVKTVTGIAWARDGTYLLSSR